MEGVRKGWREEYSLSKASLTTEHKKQGNPPGYSPSRFNLPGEQLGPDFQRRVEALRADRQLVGLSKAYQSIRHQPPIEITFCKSGP